MILPREHGTWMMFSVPIIFGIITGVPNWIHIPFMIGWFSLYLASTPMLQMIRKPRSIPAMSSWFIGYSAVALLFLSPVLWLHPLLLWIGLLIPPLLLVNVFFIKKKDERNLWNDLSGILIFSLGGTAAYTLGTGNIDQTTWIVPLITTAYFFGSALYVKSLIRERKNRRFAIYSHIYHALLLFLPWMIGIGGLVTAFLPGVMKDWFTTRKKAIKPIVIGITEIINGVLFLVLVIILFN